MEKYIHYFDREDRLNRRATYDKVQCLEVQIIQYQYKLLHINNVHQSKDRQSPDKDSRLALMKPFMRKNPDNEKKSLANRGEKIPKKTLWHRQISRLHVNEGGGNTYVILLLNGWIVR